MTRGQIYQRVLFPKRSGLNFTTLCGGKLASLICQRCKARQSNMESLRISNGNNLMCVPVRSSRAISPARCANASSHRYGTAHGSRTEAAICDHVHRHACHLCDPLRHLGRNERLPCGIAKKPHKQDRGVPGQCGDLLAELRHRPVIPHFHGDSRAELRRDMGRRFRSSRSTSVVPAISTIRRDSGCT